MKNPNGKLALLIDGGNLHTAARALGFDVDYKRLLEEFQSRGTLHRAFYFTSLEEQEYSSVRPLVDWLDYNGFTVVTKPVKEFVDAVGFRKTKRKMDVELTVQAIEIAAFVDEVVLFIGDGNFRPAIKAVQRRGASVTVVSTIACEPPMIADDLRRQADRFIELAELRPKLARGCSAGAYVRNSPRHALAAHPRDR